MINIEKIKPLNGNILVRDDSKSEKSSGGIYIPQNTSPETIVKGTVISVSDPWINSEGKEEKVDNIEAGDTVLYSFHAGAGNGTWEDEGTIYRVLRSIEILAEVFS